MEIVPPTTSHTLTIIFLHGRGSNGPEFQSELFESQASNELTLQEEFPHVKWVFPSAERLGLMTQWFAMSSTQNPHDREDEQQDTLNVSVSRIDRIISQEIAIVGSPRHVILAGISQGCATAIHALLRQESQLGGFIGISSWLPAKDTLVPSNSAAYRTPVFLAHSKDDDVIDFRYGKELCDALTHIGMNVQWHEYEHGGHWIPEPEGIDDTIAFLSQAMAAS